MFPLSTLLLFSVVVILSSSANNHSDCDGTSEGVTHLKPEDIAQIPKLSSIPVAPSVTCVLEKKIINLRKHNDLTEVFYPRTTRIDRCGGCCTQSELFACVPTETDLVYYRLFARKFQGGKNYSESKVHVVSVVRHLGCHCACRRKASDCNALQTYKQSDCACVCSNEDDKKKCLENNKIKSWNNNKCECTCLYETECTTGYSWNKHNCRCEPHQTRRTYYTPSLN